MLIQVKRMIGFHLKTHLSIYIFTIILMLIGIFFGAIVVNSLGLDQKNDLLLYLNRFFGQVSNQFGSASDLFTQSFTHYIKYIGLIWVLGLSVIGLPIILILLFLKGIVIGFTVGFLVNQMAFKGFLLAFVSVFPQNILLVPAFIIIGVASISFSLRLIKMQFTKPEPFLPLFSKYVLFMAGMVVILLISSTIEAYLSPLLMKSVIQWLQ